jgi:hypothetical protein
LVDFFWLAAAFTFDILSPGDWCSKAAGRCWCQRSPIKQQKVVRSSWRLKVVVVVVEGRGGSGGEKRRRSREGHWK